MKNHKRGNIISAAGAFYKISVFKSCSFMNKLSFYEKHKRGNKISAAHALSININVQQIMFCHEQSNRLFIEKSIK